MKRLNDLWRVILIALTSDASISSSGTSATYLFIFRKKITRLNIRKIVMTTVVKKDKEANNRASTFFAYCLVEGEGGVLSSFRVKNPQAFRMSAKRYGLKVESFIRSPESFSRAK